MSLDRVWLPSVNVSSRGGASVRLLVLHTSEGAETFYALGSYFSQSSAQVSSHVGIDDVAAGTIGEYANRSQKAWTSAGANPVAVQAELCTPSGAAMGWSVDDWHRHDKMLVNTAAWLAEEAAIFDIPLTRLTAAQAQGSGRGVCQHVDLGSWGGGHLDCGPNFPIDYVLDMARSGTIPPTMTSEDEDMLIKEPDGTVLQLIYDGAQSYWRTLPDRAAALLPTAALIEDDGTLKSLWKVGAD
jgi:hypothetical protein